MELDTAAGNGYGYTIGWDRLTSYEHLLTRERRSDHLLSATPYAENGFFCSELDMLQRRGNVSLIISQCCPSEKVPRTLGSLKFSIQKYQPAIGVHLHVKADLLDGDKKSVFRITTAHLATRRLLGPVAIGMRGIGRTELFFMTDHPDLLAESARFMRCLELNVLPSSGHYLKVETPLESGIYAAICEDIRQLRPGTGRILHGRANYSPASWKWKPGLQDVGGLNELHSLIEEYAKSGTETLVAYGEVSQPIEERLKAFSEAGATVGVPRYFPGTGMPYSLVSLLRKVPSMRRFKLSEHFNITIIEGIRNGSSVTPYGVVYMGHKSDGPYDRGTIELMVRCDTTDFPGLDRKASKLLLSRIKQYRACQSKPGTSLVDISGGL